MTSDDHDDVKKSVGRLIPEISPTDSIPRTFQPEWYAHQAGFLPFGVGERYRGPLEEEAVAEFLFTGTNILLRKFNARSPKPVIRLAGEMERREVYLYKLSPGNIKKVAAKACTEIHSPFEGVSLQEVSRLVRESGKEIIHPVPKPYGSRGTLERWKQVGLTKVEETPEEAACRELAQEHGHHATPDQLFSLTGSVPVVTQEKSTMYRYPGFRMASINVNWSFRVDTFSMVDWQTHKHRWYKGCVEYEDEGVLIRNMWLPPRLLG